MSRLSRATLSSTSNTNRPSTSTRPRDSIFTRGPGEVYRGHDENYQCPADLEECVASLEDCCEEVSFRMIE